jgi:hypothetical protein
MRGISQLSGRLSSVFPASQETADSDRWSLTATLGEEETLTLLGAEGNVKRLEGILKAILEKTALPLPDVDSTFFCLLESLLLCTLIGLLVRKITRVARSRLLDVPSRTVISKPTPKPQARSEIARNNARFGLDPHASPTRPLQDKTLRSPPVSPVKPESAKRHRELAEDPIQEVDDEKRLKPIEPPRRVYLDRTFCRPPPAVRELTKGSVILIRFQPVLAF